MRLGVLMIATAVLALANPATAQDGTVVITQASALAGNVTPGDAPGYPIRISRAGNYKLGSNLVVTGGQHGIVVTNHNVTIDLNGFAMDGQERAKTGIYSTGLNLSVRNGSILSFKGWGLEAGDISTADHLRVIGNMGGGINLGGYARVTNSSIVANLGIGVNVGFWSAIQDNLVAGNYKSGAPQIAAPNSHVLGNGIAAHEGLAIRGFFTGAGDNTIGGQDPTKVMLDGVMPMRPNACMSDESCPYDDYSGGAPSTAAALKRLAPARR